MSYPCFSTLIEEIALHRKCQIELDQNFSKEMEQPNSERERMQRQEWKEGGNSSHPKTPFGYRVESYVFFFWFFFKVAHIVYGQ